MRMKMKQMDRLLDVNSPTMAFVGGPQPTLLYITRQSFGDRKHNRPIHSHDDLCELRNHLETCVNLQSSVE